MKRAGERPANASAVPATAPPEMDKAAPRYPLKLFLQFREESMNAMMDDKIKMMSPPGKSEIRSASPAIPSGDIPAFGSIVKFSEIYRRRESIRDLPNFAGNRIHSTWKVWARKNKEDIGIFLGTRTLKNGVREYCADEGYAFSPKEHFEAALVCPGPRRSPVLVPIDSLKLV